MEAPGGLSLRDRREESPEMASLSPPEFESLTDLAQAFRGPLRDVIL